MLNIGSGEILLIAVVALLVLGPTRLPEFARGIGKFIREFRRQTDDVRNVVEREFYRMDEEVRAEPVVKPAPDSLPAPGDIELEMAKVAAGLPSELPAHDEFGHPVPPAEAPGAAAPVAADSTPSAEAPVVVAASEPEKKP